jgi:hypothetical protein
MDAPAAHPQRMESFGGDLEHRLLALRMRCLWASPGPSFVVGVSGRLDAPVLRGAGISSDRRSTAPILNCSETTALRSCAPGRRSDAQRHARLVKPGTRRNQFLLRPMLCSAIAACPTQHGRS